MIHTEILTIGDEILIGQITDTNSAWLGEQLSKSGFTIRQITSISDDEDQILSTLKEISSRADLLIITGGLGPTNDDITKKCLCRFFDTKLKTNLEMLRNVETLLSHRGVPMNELNRKQAEVPANCIPILNKKGTAPGLWFDQNNQVVVALPGVPFEMKGIMEDDVLPRLKLKFKTPKIFHKTVLTTGIPESVLATRIREWESNLPVGIKLAYLPQPGIVRLRLGGNGINIVKQIEIEIDKLVSIIPEAVFGFNDDSLEEIIGKLLRNSSKTLSLAESCTGGYLSHLITSVPGSSNYYYGSVTSYSNKIKSEILGVDPHIINNFGAVSRETVEAMAIGVQKLMGTDYAISISGIAGPEGGTAEKPVGTVWIAIASPKELISKKLQLGNIRLNNIRIAAITALNQLRMIISKTE
jgi:nicotinamide-nucleotide amidase